MTATEVKSLLTHATNERGVAVFEPPSAFEERYGRVRSLEERILTDDQVRALPDGTGLWNATEWRTRAASAKGLRVALDERGKPLNILEVGCGNGWLSALLHRAGHTVVGIDAFTAELQQAARVFDGPLFARADLFRSPLPEGRFDVVLFAASFQYFPDAAATIDRSRQLLAPQGRIHVLDTVLYADAREARSAMDRSDRYYNELGVPEMAGNYHAHTLPSLERLGGMQVLSTPPKFSRLRTALGLPASPFAHITFSR